MSYLSLLDVVKLRLENLGVTGGASGWKCMIHYAPDTQDQVISLHNSGGMISPTLRNEITHETIQVRVRSKELDYIACESKWRQMFNALQDADLSANGVVFLQAMASGPLMFNDDRNRPNATANFQVMQMTPAP